MVSFVDLKDVDELGVRCFDREEAVELRCGVMFLLGVGGKE